MESATQQHVGIVNGYMNCCGAGCTKAVGMNENMRLLPNLWKGVEMKVIELFSGTDG